MKIKEIIENEKGNYTQIEFYRFTGKRHTVHTDFIESFDEENIILYQEPTYWHLMDEDEYNGTILANSGIRADFGNWFGDKNAKVLVIIIDQSVVKYTGIDDGIESQTLYCGLSCLDGGWMLTTCGDPVNLVQCEDADDEETPELVADIIQNWCPEDITAEDVEYINSWLEIWNV